MRIFGIVVVAGLMAAGMQAASADGNSSAPASPIRYTDSTKSDHQIVCHVTVHEGIVVRKKFCSSEREWENARFEIQQNVRDLQQRGDMVH